MVDTHCHIIPKFNYLDPNTIIKNAIESGVTSMICIGCEYADIDQTLELSKSFSQIYSAIGLHPECVKEDSDIEQMFQEFRNKVLENNDKIIAIGECGLDYHFSDNEIIHIKQQSLFKKHLELCIEIKKPVIIHTRDAWDDTFKILDDIDFKSKQKGSFIITDTGSTFPNMDIVINTGIVHSFTGGIVEAQNSIERGFKLGINGIVTFKKSEDIRNAIKAVGLKHIVLETDSPFLSPEPFRGKVNEPARIKQIAEFILNMMNVS